MATCTNKMQSWKKVRERAIGEFEKLSRHPNLTEANITSMKDGEIVVDTIWAQRDLQQVKKRSFQRYFAGKIKDETITLTPGGHPVEVASSKIRCFSLCGSSKATISNSVVHGKHSQVLELWSDSRLLMSVDLNRLNKHGKVHISGQFASFSFSNDGTKLLYIAEKSVPITESYYADDSSVDKDGKYLYKQCWGESLEDCFTPIPFVFDLQSKTVISFEDQLPQQFSFMEASWVNSDAFICVGVKHKPYRLGIASSNNFPGTLFHIDISNGEVTALTDGTTSVRSPKWDKHKNSIVYLETLGFGPHKNCNQLKLMELITKTDRIVVDFVKHASYEPDNFPGLYLLKLPDNCITSDNKVVLSSSWYSNNVVLAIDLNNGSITKCTSSGSWNVLDVLDNIIVASNSAPDTPPRLAVGLMKSGKIDWTYSEKELISQDVPFIWKNQFLNPTKPNEKFPDLKYECILYKHHDNSSNEKLIVMVHGGPHSLNVQDFNIIVHVLCSLGYSVLHINYRGSFGYGMDTVYSLAGNIGEQDISDVHQAAILYKERLNAKEVFLIGGSHGGFMILQLISKYPDFYKAAAIRNPNAHYPMDQGTCDNPTWIDFEIFGSSTHDYKTLPDDEASQKMLSKSPIINIASAKTPCIFYLGEKDLCIDMSQGLLWANKYKAHGGKCQVHVYTEGGHSLEQVPYEADRLINTVKWFNEHSSLPL